MATVRLSLLITNLTIVQYYIVSIRTLVHNTQILLCSKSPIRLNFLEQLPNNSSAQRCTTQQVSVIFQQLIDHQIQQIKTKDNCTNKNTKCQIAKYQGQVQCISHQRYSNYSQAIIAQSSTQTLCKTDDTYGTPSTIQPMYHVCTKSHWQ